MEYISVKKAAEKWGISERRIQFLCGEGRIRGAFRLGHAWAIPAQAEKPTDARIKSGKYIRQTQDFAETEGMPNEDREK